MGIKTIGITEEVYERLRTRKRAEESVIELVDRRLEETTTHWRDGFRSLSADGIDELERLATDSRSALGHGLERR